MSGLVRYISVLLVTDLKYMMMMMMMMISLSFRHLSKQQLSILDWAPFFIQYS